MNKIMHGLRCKTSNIRHIEMYIRDDDNYIVIFKNLFPLDGLEMYDLSNGVLGREYNGRVLHTLTMIISGDGLFKIVDMAEKLYAQKTSLSEMKHFMFNQLFPTEDDTDRI